ncbi:MAG: DNA gyrase inhibitor YacG [Planctomycetota bacterium]
MSDRKLNPDPNPGTKTVACPSCKTLVPESIKTFPFCSSRCKSVDLGRWFNESFKISRPIEQADLEEDD